jgi:cytochrome c peroxidase
MDAPTFTGDMSGSWWDPERSGEGQFISFERTDSGHAAVLAYFTYDADGHPRWLVGSGAYSPGAETIDMAMWAGGGAGFGVDFDPGDVALERAGTIRLRFIDCARLGFEYEGGGHSLGLQLERLVSSGEEVGCASPTQQERALTGAWWNPGRSGEGQFIAFESAGDRLVATLYYFTYDDSGAPVWMIGSSDYEPGDERFLLPLNTAEGARFGAEFDPGDVRIEPAGFATLTFSGCARARLRYNGLESFGLDLDRLAGDLAGTACERPLPEATAIDAELRSLIEQHGLSGDPARGRDLPGIGAPLAHLGKLLFFSKALGAEADVACASCHHPSLGGGDALAVSVGAGAEQPDLLGPGRIMPDGSVIMHRNAPTFFNTGLLDRGLFWDSRIESLSGATGENGAQGGIRTPETLPGESDPRAGPNLLTAQARFPVVAPAEMRGAGLSGLSDTAVRRHLAARLGDYGQGQGLLPPSQWLARFQAAFESDAGAEELITFPNIALALGEYQRSAVFVESPWSAYVRGRLDAIDNEAKAGALLFFRPLEDGGLNCVRCHSGDLFTNEAHRRVGFPQVGPGFGDGQAGDFGRARETGRSGDRHAFRVPSLLNVELTAPYGHAGAYRNLISVVAHYINTRGTAIGQILTDTWCGNPPFDTQPGCADARPIALDNTRAALDSMETTRQTDPENAMPEVPLDRGNRDDLERVAAFLRTLTDPCLKNSECYRHWIPAPDEAPDDLQLDAVFMTRDSM